jgi:hypothetical protein
LLGGHVINYLSICSRSQTANLPPHRGHLTSPGIPHLRHGTVHIHLGHQQTLRPGHISGLADTAVPWLVVFGHPGQKEYELLGDRHPKLWEIVEGKDYRTERYWNVRNIQMVRWKSSLNLSIQLAKGYGIMPDKKIQSMHES